MTIATDPRYRSISLSWMNNAALGDEKVQLFVRPENGSWSLAKTFGIVVGEQPLTSWDTASPLTLYDLAFRLVRANQPAVGYESSNPDEWTAGTAAGSKTTVLAGCAPIGSFSGDFTAVGAPVVLAWSCAQTGVVFWLEKSTDGGVTFTTVATNIAATTYSYTVPPAELNTTIRFRVRSINGVWTGSSMITDVTMALTIGVPVLSASTPNFLNNVTVGLSWDQLLPLHATQLEIQKKIGAGAWTTVATYTPLYIGYNISVAYAELNTTMTLRMRGVNGVFTGAWSNEVTISTATPSANAPTVGVQVNVPVAGQTTLTITLSPPVSGYYLFEVYRSDLGGWVTYGAQAINITVVTVVDYSVIARFRATQVTPTSPTPYPIGPPTEVVTTP